jgi:SAM-dependent methyltransferase
MRHRADPPEDAADRLRLHTLREDPDRWEAAIREEIGRARTDPQARAVVESVYLDEDRDAAFERFRSGLEFREIVRLLDRLGVHRRTRICELGGGPGWLSWALHREGFAHVDLLEPNPHYVTGTGYLRSRPDAAGVRIWNDLDAWYADPGRYDLILTHNCVHHFRGLSVAAAQIRQKVVPDGRWVMVREWYADDPRELYQRLAEHPYSQRYGVFEFPYPAAYYVDSVEFAGFALEAVVPAGYANGALETYVADEGSPGNRLATRAVAGLLDHAPAATAWLYRLEQAANRYLRLRRRRFTRPAAMVFRRRSL